MSEVEIGRWVAAIRADPAAYRLDAYGPSMTVQRAARYSTGQDRVGGGGAAVAATRGWGSALLGPITRRLADRRVRSVCRHHPSSAAGRDLAGTGWPVRGRRARR